MTVHVPADAQAAALRLALLEKASMYLHTHSYQHSSTILARQEEPWYTYTARMPLHTPCVAVQHQHYHVNMSTEHVEALLELTASFRYNMFIQAALCVALTAAVSLHALPQCLRLCDNHAMMQCITTTNPADG
jgi:hypothetical protein